MKDLISNKWFWIIVGLLATLIAYIPVFQNGFINWDDDYYILHNPLIQSLNVENLMNWFSKPFMGLYQPLILFSFALDYKINGADPVIFHATNLLLHLLNTLLVFIFLSGLIKNNKIALLAMFLFGLHPIHRSGRLGNRKKRITLWIFLPARPGELPGLSKRP